MSFASLVWINLKRNKVRTVLTVLSVLVALFLFCALRGVLDTLNASIEVGRESRLVSRNKISLVFPLPLAYRDRIGAVPGVKRIGYGNWFGGRDPVDPGDFYAQFAVDDGYLPIYRSDVEIVAATVPQGAGGVPEGSDPKLASYYEERTACVVGQRLFDRKGWKLGQTIQISGTIFPGTWPMTIRAVYRAIDPAFGEESIMFHWDYLNEKGMNNTGQVGWYVLDLADPNGAGSVIEAVDRLYANSAAATLTETERAFQAGFVSMYGNVPFLIGVIGFAVVIAMLAVAANTMMMAARERTNEFAVMKTLGFGDGTLFALVLAEAALLTLLGGVSGALLAKFAIEGSDFNAFGFLPPMEIRWSTIALGISLALAMGMVSGLVPAVQAARLRIVDALRRVD
jgi:putative ABC transport system permease protein